jgi:undecaprenyl-diphosphatase
VCAVVFVVAAVLARHGHVPGFDRSLTARLVRSNGSTLFRFGDLVSTISSGPVAGALAVAFGACIWWRTRDVLLAAITPVAGLLGGITELIGKSVVGRLRPPTAALTGEYGNGFPSGHTTGFTALVVAAVVTLTMLGVQAKTRRIVTVVAVVAAAVVALGRVMVGAHYALDAVAGLALGALCALVTVVLAGVPAIVGVGQRLDEQVERLAPRRRSSAGSV